MKTKTILVLGSGALKIGEAGEFDYSGSQAIKALKEEGYRVVLVNPNIATIQTSEGRADDVYFYPVTEEFVTRIIEKEKPYGILLSFGGQTALNCGLALHASGVLKKHGVTVFGPPIDSIRDTEDRELFTKRLAKIGLQTAKGAIARSVEEGVRIAKKIGYPVMIRSGFALGGTGSGVVATEKALRDFLPYSFASSAEVVIEECLTGWKEIEYEVVRDSADNCITVCNMENFDPVGIHTGESIVVAPSQTLTNSEYFMLREAAIKAIRELKIVGECNIQYAVNPVSHEFRVIEVNARLSRSSALASKATGYPLAYIAAKLAVGRTLTELKNTVTGDTSAFFEPSLDYCVVKMPRWDLSKFSAVSKVIGSEMKSVGEVMAIGRTFEEAIQKAARMLNDGYEGVIDKRYGNETKEVLLSALSSADPTRLFTICSALRAGATPAEIIKKTGIDAWFIGKLTNIIDVYHEIENSTLNGVYPELACTEHAEGEGHPKAKTKDLPITVIPAKAEIQSERIHGSPIGSGMTIPDAEISNVIRTAKQSGFSDRQIADITGTEESKIRTLRKKYGITPVIKRIDTMAGEFPAKTNYLFMTYHGDSSEYFGTDQKAEDRRQKANDRKQKTEKLKLSNEPPSSVIGLQSSTENFQSSSHKKRAIVLGCGPYAIGTSVEFDWCAVTAVATLRERGWESVVINCNPETVSTDYDTADILFFEELTFERVQDIYECVNAPFIISVGGQIPNSLAPRLAACDIPILGTTPVDIERAEDRGLFSALLDKIGVLQPSWTTAVSVDDVQKKAKDLGYPVLVRPSFVLSGKGMCIVTNDDELAYYLETLDPVVLERPLTISRFLARATECDVDGVAKDGKSIVMAISEHVESGGVHSGDSTLMLPAPTIPSAIQETLKMISKSIIAELHVTGPWNIQYLIVDDVPYVIECNLRASRSVPFVSKTLGINFIARATDALLGMDALPVTEKHITYTGVKAPQFSYRKLRGADPVPAIEMNSTGEVASFGRDQFEGYMSAYLSTGVSYPHKKGIFVSLGGKEMKIRFLSHVTALSKAGFSIYSTTGTALFLKEYGIPVTTVGKLYEGVHPTAEDLVKNGQIDAAIVIPERLGEEKKGRVIKGLSDGYQLRRLAIDRMIPLFTNDETAAMFVNSLIRYSPETIMIKSMREWRGSL